jgi:hypothetical protein
MIFHRFAVQMPKVNLSEDVSGTPGTGYDDIPVPVYNFS